MKGSIKMKFKVGDIVKDKITSDTYKIVKIAETGELIEGPWFYGEEFKVPVKSYILENKEGFWCYNLITNENELELIQRPVQTPQQDLSSPFPTLKEFLGV
jgi:hypothetical protein